jgi:two-component system nitrogen regulation sensor histidine kinase NtrY
VKKIIEEHGGTLALRDAPVFDGCAHNGALAEIRLPLLAAAGRDPAEGGRVDNE